jgi:hypothetical protein
MSTASIPNPLCRFPHNKKGAHPMRCAPFSYL